MVKQPFLPQTYNSLTTIQRKRMEPMGNRHVQTCRRSGTYQEIRRPKMVGTSPLLTCTNWLPIKGPRLCAHWVPLLCQRRVLCRRAADNWCPSYRAPTHHHCAGPVWRGVPHGHELGAVQSAGWYTESERWVPRCRGEWAQFARAWDWESARSGRGEV